MQVLTQDAVVLCDHQGGVVSIVPSQILVSVDGRKVLVEPDPVAKPIAGCPNVGPTIKPCTSTLPVTAGYSTFIRIDGRRICLDTVRGLTDGMPPGTVNYSVKVPGQKLVSSQS